MSLLINVDNVTAVRLVDDWYTVDDGSFYTDAYEYIERDPDGEIDLVFGGGQSPLIPSTGFGFKWRGRWMYGPLTSIIAVQCARKSCS